MSRAGGCLKADAIRTHLQKQVALEEELYRWLSVLKAKWGVQQLGAGS